ncbi:deoxyribodipyrimidine photo-lyase [Draconibacterium sp. IB214405]|uniref:cryptochrome/photolyase family protein n=1 Tax=Draconibacterium sp. IB214405 TaxID=3097352 RepID=UPI002A1719B5|nr:deoxyribodipyrimidine photo-lyase [Draconibacterium sp. IB214405]MDX8340221.1 deoxyribodipyrimidine photo-lyase [Draconibacterium sp. IB214405]
MINITWLRRDLRLTDNTALNHALRSDNKVLVLFIFDTNILDELDEDDARITFIHQRLTGLDQQLHEVNSGLVVKSGDPIKIWQELISNFKISEVHFNRDYEPYATKRDDQVKQLLQQNNISTFPHKDQVIFEPHEVLKADNTPYTVYTPYKNKWLEHFNPKQLKAEENLKTDRFAAIDASLPTLEEIGFQKSSIAVKDYDLSVLSDYSQTRDIPSLNGTSNLSVHLRFGTVSIRKIVNQVYKVSPVFLSELIWREFFMQILFHFPRVVNENFRAKYNGIQWRNNEKEFERWCAGETGYPIVDAGMRELNKTGYMHNRVRMITASFLCKHLLIDWRWGEAYFAKKLLDFELSSNNGNWQWAAGTGCDAAPYFRVFNPTEQVKKFDKDFRYIQKWVPEFRELTYPAPMVDHKMARNRALETYKKGIAD